MYSSTASCSRYFLFHLKALTLATLCLFKHSLFVTKHDKGSGSAKKAVFSHLHDRHRSTFTHTHTYPPLKVPYLYSEQNTLETFTICVPVATFTQLLLKSRISVRLSVIASPVINTATDDDLMLGLFMITTDRLLPTTPTTVMIGRTTMNNQRLY